MKIITTYKQNDGSALEGLNPKITINNITDFSDPLIVIEDQEMVDLGFGFYGCIFNEYENGKEYSVYIDGDDEEIPNRFQYGTIDKFNLSNLEENLDLGQMIRIMFAVLTGTSSGGGTNEITFKNITKNKNRIKATVDNSGNRLDVEFDGE